MSLTSFVSFLRARNCFAFMVLKGGKRLLFLLVYKTTLSGIRFSGRRGNMGPPCRILVTGDVATNTGPFTFLRNLCDALRADHEVILSFHRGEISAELRRFCKDMGLRLIARRWRRPPLDVFAVEAVVRRHRIDLQIVNVSAFPSNSHLIALRIPTVYYVHSIWCPEIGRKEAWAFSKFLDERHRVVAVSQAAVRSLSQSYASLREKHLFVDWIHNWVPDEPDWTRAPIRHRDKVVVLTVGTVISYKNPEAWVRIARRVIEKLDGTWPIEFWWAGDGPLLASFRQPAKVDPRIQFLGFMKDPRQLYAQASVYFQPSLLENCSLSVCDALMFGLPCVVTNRGGLPEQIVNGENGFVFEPSEEDGMADTIAELAKSGAAREKMGRSSRQRFLEAFSIEPWQRRFEWLLREIQS